MDDSNLDQDVWHEPTIVIDKMRDVEKAHIMYALAVMNQNRTHTAKALGIGVRTLQRKLNKYKAEE